MTRGARLVVWVALCLVAAPPVARAQQVEAETLFREGKRLLHDGKIAEACAKFDASNRMDPSAGTLLNLGQCRETNHELASAWEAFLKASSLSIQNGDKRRAAEAKRRAAEVEKRLSYVTITVATEGQAAKVVIKRDGNAVDPALWNQDVPVNLGTYQITAEAEGRQPWSSTVEIKTERQRARVEVPALAPSVTTTPTPTLPSHPEPTALPVAAVATHPSRFTTTRKVAVASAVVGVAGLAAGVIFGRKAQDLQHQADAVCPAAACADPTAVQQNHDAQHDATLANIGFVVGGVGIAGAVALWVFGAPSEHHDVVTVIPSGDRVGIAILGRF